MAASSIKSGAEPQIHFDHITTRSATVSWSFDPPLPRKTSVTFTLTTRLMSIPVAEITTHYKGPECSCIAENLFPNEKYVLRLICEWDGGDHTTTEVQFSTPDESDLHRASTQLTRAVTDGDVLATTKLLDTYGKELSLETRDKYGRTQLMVACHQGGHELVSILIEHGADISAKTPSGKTPLAFACSSGNLAAVQVLLKHDASVDKIDSAGTTPLMICCENMVASNSGMQILRALLAAGVSVNIEDQANMTALDRICITSGHVESAKVLVDAGARLVNKPDKRHTKTNLMMAALNGHVGLCRYLLENCHQDPNAKTELGGTARMFAESAGHQGVVELFDAIVWGSSHTTPSIRFQDS
ncbi:hypothetical protein SmJEL517_g05476 [Synchytrium microbalum]|uniref:Fibronectin type-III domain-containing protein n=1 Tax=Synchytrium microbalum TaxID=1806994 RepID=A0A507BW50_9FUNG|nr:uncharacterized protein SmJEL517_g05476 [Synchytrium microbalum]TPX31129.1 hypothetical protein SmJEL517_g05476 [Synchytrium microbalum]